MVKSKKKKQKDLDFQKVKLKVGRKLKKDDNETKAEFKSRKIVIKELRSYSDDPLNALSRHSEHISHQGKLSMLNHFNTALTPDIVVAINKPILDSLSKFILDHSEKVRAATIRCLKTCYNHLKKKNISTTDFMMSLKPYVDCAYTHVVTGIVSDCQKLMEYFINLNDPQLFEPLMLIFLRRYEAGNLSMADRNLAVRLRHYYIRHKQKQIVESMMRENDVEPLVWTPENFLLDLDLIRRPRQVVGSGVDIIQKYLDTVCP